MEPNPPPISLREAVQHRSGAPDELSVLPGRSWSISGTCPDPSPGVADLGGKVLAKRDFREKGSVELPYVSARAPICWLEKRQSAGVTKWSSKGSRWRRGIGAIRALRVTP